MASAAPTWNDGCTVSITVSNASMEALGWICVNTIAALRNLATSSNNKGAAVRTGDTGPLRLYRWDSTSTGTDDGVSTIAPSDGGTGRWILEL